MAIELNNDALDKAFDLPKMSYDDYKGQEVFETGDGEFFDALDEAFGVVPRADELIAES